MTALGGFTAECGCVVQLRVGRKWARIGNTVEVPITGSIVSACDQHAPMLDSLTVPPTPTIPPTELITP